ncbi:MAG: 30S ribosome-binding factor RbfA [Acidobacteriota bacterium]|nr:30S ribosome-binding factor RbfA [Acidobacteriota bacterium]
MHIPSIHNQQSTIHDPKFHMQPSRRPQRLAFQIQREISMMLSRGLKNHDIGFVTVTGVRMSADLKHARVFVSPMGSEDEKKETLEALRGAAGRVRHELGSRIRTRYLPEIDFVIDTSQEYGDHIDRLLDEIRRQQEEE